MAGYKTICVECGGVNFYVTQHNNMGYCFNCGYTERDDNKPHEAVKQSAHVDRYRMLYEEISQYYHSCLSTEHTQYLHARGLSDDTIQQYRIGYCAPSNHVLYLTPHADDSGLTINQYPVLSNRIVFPYFLNGNVVDIRGRLFRGNGEKYLSLMKSGKYRGANVAYNIDRHDNTIVVTEGEIKSLLPSQYGYIVHGIPGILSKRTIANKPYSKTIICLDSQKGHEREIQRAIMCLSQRVIDPHVATLPLRNKDKQDIDSYILDYGIAAFDSVIKNSIPLENWKQLHGYNRL